MQITIKKNHAKTQLREKIENFFSDTIFTSSAFTEKKLVRIQVRIQRTEPLQWLRHQVEEVKTYWCDRKKTVETAGIGAADLVQADKEVMDPESLFRRLTRYLNDRCPALRYYGGMRFNNRHPAKDILWQPFGSYWFVVPRFEICVEENRYYLACNILYDPNSNIRKQYENLLQELERINLDWSEENHRLPLPLSRQDIPVQKSWRPMIHAALRSFSRRELQKVVLARQANFHFSEQLDPLLLLIHLKRSNPRAFHFCFQLQEDLAFLGGTPERLYRRDKRQIHSEAIAGTRPRGLTTQEDQVLEQALLNSDKEIREHRFVVSSIQQALNQLCACVDEHEAVSVLKLPRLQHLFAQFQGVLKGGVEDGEILTSMHPTPAVGGYPHEAALREIERLEPFDRGWYAGPVGWVGTDSAEFVVAIRSGLVHRHRLRLYAGAGIVKGSSAPKEWQEIENKIASFMTIFRGEGRDQQ